VGEHDVVGYTYLQEYQDTGYIRIVIVAPHARRRGVGRALMEVVAERLRGRGINSWCLNVRPNNHAACALYTQMGMKVQYPSTVLRVPWTALAAVPAGSATVRELLPARDRMVEVEFDLPRGQLGHVRASGRQVLEAVREPNQEPAGVTVFNSTFASAFPFRVGDIEAVGPLLGAIRLLVPDHEFVTVVADDDARLVAMLTAAGALIKDEILHLYGRL
jgi:hypothetical protein